MHSFVNVGKCRYEGEGSEKLAIWKAHRIEKSFMEAKVTEHGKSCRRAKCLGGSVC